MWIKRNIGSISQRFLSNISRRWSITQKMSLKFGILFMSLKKIFINISKDCWIFLLNVSPILVKINSSSLISLRSFSHWSKRRTLQFIAWIISTFWKIFSEISFFSINMNLWAKNLMNFVKTTKLLISWIISWIFTIRIYQSFKKLFVNS